MLVAIDIDGVLYPLHEIVRDWMVEEMFIPGTYSVKEAFKFLRKQDAAFIDYVFGFPEIYERRLPNKRVLEDVWKIHKDGAEIIYLTARDIEFKGITIRWLKDFPAPEAVFFEKNKQKFCEENNVDVLLDDRIMNLEDHSRTLALCVQPFNHPEVIEPRFRSIWKAYLFAKCQLERTPEMGCNINFYE